MHSDPSIDPHGSVTLHNPIGIAASLPHLLGFHPVESLVCLWLREGALIVTQRVDLDPLLEMTAEEFVAAFMDAAAHVTADAAICVVVTRNDEQVRRLCASLRSLLPIRCPAMLHVRGSQVRELSTHNVKWQWIDSRSRQWAANSFPRSAPALSRTRIESECEPDPVAYAAMGEFRPGSTPAMEQLRAFADAAAGQFEIDSSSNSPRGRRSMASLEDRQLRDVVADSRGRDLVLLIAAQLAPGDRDALLQALLRCTRATPPGQAGHTAAAAGVVAWLCGDGVRANVALERCLLDDPDNVLGAVLDHAVRTGVPPEKLRVMLADIPVLDIVPS